MPRIDQNKPIHNYIDIKSSFGIARFYGDRIIITDTQQCIVKEDIASFTIHWFRRKIGIILKGTQKPIIFSYHETITTWLNPLYSVLRFFTISTFTVSLVLSTYFLGTNEWILCLLYSFFSTGTFLLYSKLLRLPLRKSFLYTSLLYIVYNIPLLLFIPFATNLWALFILTVFLYIILSLFIFNQESVLFNKLYVSIVWILLSIGCYYWIVGYIKIRNQISYQKQISIQPQYELGSGAYSLNTLRWQPISYWNISPFSMIDSIVGGREIIFQILPISPFAIIHLPDQKYSGWVASVSQTPQQMLSFLAHYLDTNKQFIFTKLLYVSEITRLKPEIANEKKIIMLGQQYLFFDFKEKKEVILNIIIANSNKNNSNMDNSYVWLLKSDEVYSLEYFMSILSNSLSVYNY